MSQEEEVVWFHLVDSKGNPYAETTVASISVQPTMMVDQLRDAVFQKNAPILQGFVASQLKVYLNKFAVEQGPLKASSNVEGGANEEDALCILVPTETDSLEEEFEELQKMYVGQMNAILREYIQSFSIRSDMIAELNKICLRQKERATAGFSFQRPEHQSGFQFLNPQQQLAERQKYERRELERQQDDQAKNSIHQELKQQDQHSMEILKMMREFGSLHGVIFPENQHRRLPETVVSK